MDFESIIAKGEGISIEFKRAENDIPENLFETVCAFLNRNGGVILLGVDDDKRVWGVDVSRVERMCKEISNLSNNPQKLNPSFLLEPSVVEIEGEKLTLKIRI